MNLTPTRRVAAAACIVTVAGASLAALAGCERRTPEVPTPRPGFPVPPTPERTTVPTDTTRAASAPVAAMALIAPMAPMAQMAPKARSR